MQTKVNLGFNEQFTTAKSVKLLTDAMRRLVKSDPAGRNDSIVYNMGIYVDDMRIVYMGIYVDDMRIVYNMGIYVTLHMVRLF